ncbi:NAD(P)-binding domain-containing protein [Paenibacillus sp. OAS669]|uniref:NAD(P)-binding domain-containing protein n=1 Tax=Paenibacillus sp. OAS669 TaxID=2663821 RepID=UPI00178A46EB|nr:NAD(P)-binding domain-containing protein [Paenibacillus sp. OAS669]MBE1445640.1 3-hydroxyisobutyrate dehydrogenase-like beta-hydroxyacid dehydrogenase [Paenibacillus sp. OAS669]
MKRIGFIGLGTMGKPMAANLLKKGYDVVVYNRSSEKAAELVSLGARTASTPSAAALDMDVVVLMLSNDAVVLEAVLGEQGIIHGVSAGQTVIDCSTVSPDTSKRIAGELLGRAVDFLDAPVTGSKPAAESGTLVFMIGGEQAVLERQCPVFEAMGSKIVYMGPTGSGSYAKLAHNTMVGINALGLVEGLSIVTKAGLDAEQFLQIVFAGSGNSKQAELKGGKIINRDFSNQFSLQLMLKDLLLANEVTNRFQMPSPMLKAAAGIFQMGLSKGLGDADLCSVAQVYEDWMQQQIGKASPVVEERRRSSRVQLNIPLHLSVHQWEQEGAFTGQTIPGILYDLSENGLQIISQFPLAEDMFVVIHFPKEAVLPPVTGRVIRIESDNNGSFRYGCLLSGLAPFDRLQLETYIASHLNQQ